MIVRECIMDANVSRCDENNRLSDRVERQVEWEISIAGWWKEDGVVLVLIS